MLNDAGMFLTRFLRHPWRVGAVAASSPSLAARAVAPVPASGEPMVVELGAGTGAFTGAIQERLGGRGYHLAVEVDPVDDTSTLAVKRVAVPGPACLSTLVSASCAMRAAVVRTSSEAWPRS